MNENSPRMLLRVCADPQAPGNPARGADLEKGRAWSGTADRLAKEKVANVLVSVFKEENTVVIFTCQISL